jgi:hypothetical protein
MKCLNVFGSDIILQVCTTDCCSINRGCRDHDHMVVGFTTTYAISPYHHWHCEFESCSWWGVHNIMWYSLSVTCSRSVVFSGYFGFVIWNVTYIEVIAKNCIRFGLAYVLYFIFILRSRILYKSTTYPCLYHVCPISPH